VILALRGAKACAEAEFRRLMSASWMCGLLSQVDPKMYPKLEDIVGESSTRKPATVETDPAEASANLRAWGVWLNTVNRRAERGLQEER
jgi:hypothetical protein